LKDEQHIDGNRIIRDAAGETRKKGGGKWLSKDF